MMVNGCVLNERDLSQPVRQPSPLQRKSAAKRKKEKKKRKEERCIRRRWPEEEEEEEEETSPCRARPPLSLRNELALPAFLSPPNVLDKVGRLPHPIIELSSIGVGRLCHPIDLPCAHVVRRLVHGVDERLADASAATALVDEEVLQVAARQDRPCRGVQEEDGKADDPAVDLGADALKRAIIGDKPASASKGESLEHSRWLRPSSKKRERERERGRKKESELGSFAENAFGPSAQLYDQQAESTAPHRTAPHSHSTSVHRHGIALRCVALRCTQRNSRTSPMYSPSRRRPASACKTPSSCSTALPRHQSRARLGCEPQETARRGLPWPAREICSSGR